VLPILRNVCLLGSGLLFALLHRNDINNKEMMMLDKQFLSFGEKDLGILKRIFLKLFTESSKNQNLLWMGRQNIFLMFRDPPYLDNPLELESKIINSTELYKCQVCT
jgi:hypothetical protein